MYIGYRNRYLFQMHCLFQMRIQKQERFLSLEVQPLVAKSNLENIRVPLSQVYISKSNYVTKKIWKLVTYFGEKKFRILLERKLKYSFKKILTDLVECYFLYKVALYPGAAELRCSTRPLVFGCWKLSHVIFLKLRKKELLAKLSKFTK